MRTSRRVAAALGALALAVAFAAGNAVSASAHDTLQTSIPGVGETVTEPLETVTLTYSEDLLALGTETNGFAIQVVDLADQSQHADGCVTVSGQVASASVALGEPGDYEVRWQVVSSDGHPISGSYSFSSAAAARPETQTVMTAPACGDAWAGGVPVAAGTDAPDNAADATDTATEPATPESDAPSPSPDAATPDSTEPPASDELDVPLGAIVIGSLGILAVIAMVIVLTLRRHGSDG